MGLLDSFGFDNIELWRSEEMQLVQVCWVAEEADNQTPDQPAWAHMSLQHGPWHLC
jgi:hypothetical protein